MKGVTEKALRASRVAGGVRGRIPFALIWARHQCKRAIHVVRILPTVIKRGGGLRSTLSKAIRIYRNEGLSGIRRGMILAQTSIRTNPTLESAGHDRNDYQEWIKRYDTIDDECRQRIVRRIESLSRKPKISVVMPVYDPSPEFLDKAIWSVRRQIYQAWELCIADDASKSEAVRNVLEKHASEDSRIQVVYRNVNGHISVASNSALALSTGEFIAFLDHDDLLAEHALFCIAEAVLENPDVALIYSDEDKIDEHGRRHDPYFKCGWNLDLFYSHNLITHLAAYRSDILAETGGLREGLEGAQDYDLALRVIERIEPEAIHHIPRVLYHWRVHVKSTALSADSKPYAMLAGERALNEHLHRQNVRARAELVGYGYRIRYALPETPPKVSLIIPTRNGFHLIRKCIESILNKTTYPNYEMIIVDNGSDDEATVQYLNKCHNNDRIRVLRDEGPFNYSALNNAAANLARGEVIGLLNNDIEVISPDWLTEMVSIALQPKTGAVGARLWYPDNTLQHGGVILGIGGWAGHAHKGFHKGHPGYVGRASLVSDFSAVTGACLIVRKRLYEELGGLNETDLPIACNDVDFCLRLREAGYRNIWTPYAEMYHHESATRGYEDTDEKKARFAREVEYMKRKWGALMSNDPAYSPNLTLHQEDFSLAWPPRVEHL